MSRTSYIRGDKIRHTGKVEKLYGGLFEVCVYLEGHRKGQTLHVPVKQVCSNCGCGYESCDKSEECDYE